MLKVQFDFDSKKNNLIKSLYFFCLIFIFLPLNIFSQIAGGGYSESYLLNNCGSRPIALAGAYTAIVNEPMGIFYNPAGLAFLSSIPLISTSHSILSYNRTHSTIAWAQSFEGYDYLGFGAGINNYTSGPFLGRNIAGHPIGEKTDWHYSINLAAAYRIDYASIGVALKYLSSSLQGDGAMANGYGFDIGAKFNILDILSFGVSVQNISGIMFWNTENKTNELLPYTIRSGLAMEFGLNEETYTTRSTVTGDLETYYVPATRYILLSLDAVMNQYENAPSLLLGIEAVPHEYVAFRLGLTLASDNLNKYEFFPMNNWGAGVSIKPPLEDYNLAIPFKTNIDYSVSSDYLAKDKIAHHISLILEF